MRPGSWHALTILFNVYKKQVDYELTTSSRSRAVSTVKAAIASSRPASSQTRGWHRERARPTTSRSRKWLAFWGEQTRAL